MEVVEEGGRKEGGKRRTRHDGQKEGPDGVTTTRSSNGLLMKVQGQEIEVQGDGDGDQRRGPGGLRTAVRGRGCVY